jgi:hypothetical protein
MSAFKDEIPIEGEAPVEDKTPLLETAPCKICPCTDFESSSSDDKVCKCGHKDTDHKDVIWPGA